MQNQDDLKDDEIGMLEKFISNEIGAQDNANYYVNFHSTIGLELNASLLLWSDVLSGEYTPIHTLILLFPITTESGSAALNYVRETLFDRDCLNIKDVKINNLYVVDKVCNFTQNWIRNLPMFKNMAVDNILLPDLQIENYMLIKWMHYTLFNTTGRNK